MTSFLGSFINWLQKPFKSESSPMQDDPPPQPPLLSPIVTHESNLALFQILSKPGGPNRRPALPPELILQILSHPSRWLRTNLALSQSVRVSSSKRSKVLLRTGPLSSETLQSLRKIVLKFRAKDQGWSSYPQDHGTYENSWTWFSLAIGKGGSSSQQHPPRQQNDRGGLPTDDEDLVMAAQPSMNPAEEFDEENTYLLQRNRHAGNQEEDYEIEIYPEDDRLKSLEPGDEIALLACAMFGGWENYVETAQMELWLQDDISDV